MKPTTSMVIEIAATRVARVYARHFLTSASGRQFMGSFIPAVQKSTPIRERYERDEELYIPTFILASFSPEGTGLYQCLENTKTSNDKMSASEWRAFFAECTELGITTCLITLGEPLLNLEALEVAAEFSQMLFGAMVDPRYFNEELVGFFKGHQNILPLLTIDMDGEKSLEETESLYINVCDQLRMNRVPYGCTFLVHKGNFDICTDFDFAQKLKKAGSNFFIYMRFYAYSDDQKKIELSSSQVNRLKEYCDDVKDAFSDSIAMHCPDDLTDLGGEQIESIGHFVVKSNGDIETLMNGRTYDGLSVKNASLLDSLRVFYTIEEANARAMLI